MVKHEQKSRTDEPQICYATLLQGPSFDRSSASGKCLLHSNKQSVLGAREHPNVKFAKERWCRTFMRPWCTRADCTWLCIKPCHVFVRLKVQAAQIPAQAMSRQLSMSFHFNLKYITADSHAHVSFDII